MTLSEKIQQNLMAHIRAGILPCPLTLTGIAEHYSVSLMPARVAVASLVKRRVLLRKENRRLEINPRGRIPVQGAIAMERSAPDGPYQLLADHIIHLSLHGKDTFLREEATSERYGVGRTVIRRIFARLSGESLIEHVPRRGWRVHPYREKDMLDYLDVRESLELRAVELAWPRMNPSHLHRLLVANTPDEQGNPRMDNSLHKYWIDLADNRYIREFLAQYGVYFQALFDHAVIDGPTVADRAAEHREILMALIDRDLQRARRVLSQHIQGQRPNVARMLSRLSEGRDVPYPTRRPEH
jgi:DNA-binding GntR family transcriptional regulator